MRRGELAGARRGAEIEDLQAPRALSRRLVEDQVVGLEVTMNEASVVRLHKGVTRLQNAVDRVGDG